MKCKHKNDWREENYTTICVYQQYITLKLTKYVLISLTGIVLIIFTVGDKELMTDYELGILDSYYFNSLLLHFLVCKV